MRKINFTKRDLTQDELRKMKAGFDNHTVENGVAIQHSERFGWVASGDRGFLGCASGLAYKNGKHYSGWFYLTDLYVEGNYRREGIGTQMLDLLEEELAQKHIRKIWTWTAGYEAPDFYKKRGYIVFTEMEDYYSDRSSRVGLRKTLIIP